MPEHPSTFDCQLHQSQRLETLGTLAGGVAHDFNNQLTVILNNLVLAMESLDPSHPAHDCLEDADRAARRCVDIARGLLAFSRRYHPMLRSVDFASLLTETARLLRSVLPASITLRVSTQKGLRPAMADATQLQQVMMNLAVNARDAMPEGGTLEFLAESAGDEITFTVKDTGVGMSREVRERAFEPFFTTKLENGGTGLGLATVLEIVRAHRGDLEMETAPGQGTTLRIRIPAAAAAPCGEPGQGCSLKRARASVLVVEDDELVRRAAVTILRLNGCSVLEAGDGEEALRLFKEHASSIDLVFTDHGMPKCGGPLLIERLRLIRPGVKTLLASGHNTLRARWFLPKPYSARDLITKVNELLAA